jgi:hypothetical protein
MACFWFNKYDFDIRFNGAPEPAPAALAEFTIAGHAAMCRPRHAKRRTEAKHRRPDYFASVINLGRGVPTGPVKASRTSRR